MIAIQINYRFTNGFVLKRPAKTIESCFGGLIYNFTKRKLCQKAIYIPFELCWTINYRNTYKNACLQNTLCCKTVIEKGRYDK
jgi:hypothetical protein